MQEILPGATGTSDCRRPNIKVLTESASILSIQKRFETSFGIAFKVHSESHHYLRLDSCITCKCE